MPPPLTRGGFRWCASKSRTAPKSTLDNAAQLRYNHSPKKSEFQSLSGHCDQRPLGDIWLLFCALSLPCCGAQNNVRRYHDSIILTAATRSPRFICRWQRFGSLPLRASEDPLPAVFPVPPPGASPAGTWPCSATHRRRDPPGGCPDPPVTRRCGTGRGWCG